MLLVPGCVLVVLAIALVGLGPGMPWDMQTEAYKLVFQQSTLLQWYREDLLEPLPSIATGLLLAQRQAWHVCSSRQVQLWSIA